MGIDYSRVSGQLDPAAFAAAMERIAMGIAVTAPSGRIDHANAWLCRLLGLTAAELSGLHLAQFRLRDTMRLRMEIRRAGLAGDTWQDEIELYAGGGLARPMLESVYPLHDAAGRVVQVLHFFHDAAALRYAGRLARRAFHDPLTGLPNRHLLTDRIQSLIAVAQLCRRALVAVLYLDVENLQRVNERLGRETGDELLREIALRIERALRKSDTIARVGGDEFAILLGEAASAHLAVRTAEKVLRACTGWYEHGNAQHSVTFRVGVAVYPRDGLTPEALVHSAEAAMYAAKAARRDAFPEGEPCSGNRYCLGRGDRWPGARVSDL